MLFYKRVEVEEDNGKDFSFDVSPDLLEVVSLFVPPILKHFYLTILNFPVSLFSGFGMTICSFYRIRTYLSTLILGEYRFYLYDGMNFSCN